MHSGSDESLEHAMKRVKHDIVDDDEDNDIKPVTARGNNDNKSTTIMTAAVASATTTLPWVEKYRPRTLDQVQAQDEAVAALRACLRDGVNMPHMLFYGPPGTGKTTAILAVARELFGPDMAAARVREMNASDDRGIAVVREKIKVFANSAVGSAGARVVQSDGKTYPVPPFKLIILDEADALLPDAQAALRRMMEDYSAVTRFCILCNYVSRIIDPIASRCAKFRFKPLVGDALHARITAIASAEGIALSPHALRALDAVSGGDMRLAIMHLQSAHKAQGADLRDADFVAVSGSVPAEVLREYVATLHTRDVTRVVAHTRRLVAGGYAAALVVSQLHDYLVSAACTYDSTQRSLAALKLCEVERRLSDGGDDGLQLLDLGVALCSL